MSEDVLVAYLIRHEADVAAEVTQRMRERRPDVFHRYNRTVSRKDKTVEQWCTEDTVHHLQALAAALSVNDASEFAEYHSWLIGLLAGRGIPAQDVVDNFESIAEVLQERLGESAQHAVAMLLGPGEA